MRLIVQGIALPTIVFQVPHCSNFTFSSVYKFKVLLIYTWLNGLTKDNCQLHLTFLFKILTFLIRRVALKS